MKLEWDGKSIEVKTKEKITPLLKVKFVEIMQELKTDEIDEKRLQTLEKIKPTESEKIEFVNIKPLLEFALLQKKFASPEVIFHNDKVFIRAFKEIIDTEKLPDDWQNLVKQNEESEFWLSQDITEITKEIESFRTKIGV
ncbi:MAG: hypothetical protein N2560_08740 [Ignavibacteria bacterium]|nr:hypothetical protein [Ignavibacteria bacterium]